ncbi:hypothetical protein [Comamonas sp.]|uniref:helix-turn-helix transcriptional regulator n=1 Tax=Comamonas sp. TaxID=34028 RepID=UPI0028A2471B|nr:hypothetical protein [Comamonas sp.]
MKRKFLHHASLAVKEKKLDQYVEKARRQIELARAVPDARIGTKTILALADISRPTLYRWIKLGQFPAQVAPGKWRGGDVLQHLAQKAAQPST